MTTTTDVLILQITCAGHSANIPVDSGASLDLIDPRYLANTGFLRPKKPPWACHACRRQSKPMHPDQ